MNGQEAIVCPTCGRSLGDLDAPGLVGGTHPETSRVAATVPSFGSQRFAVLDALRLAGTATAADLADVVGLSRNQCATRLLELRRGGYAQHVLDEHGRPERRATGKNTEGRLHRITPAGRAVVDRW